MNSDSRAALFNLVARFANSLDLKDWDGLASCLDDTLQTDYSELRGTPPETVSRESFVEFRRQGLSVRNTHHLTGNIEVSAEGEGANVVASMLVFIQEPPPQGLLTIHCVYFFKARATAVGWRIHDIRQKILLK